MNSLEERRGHATFWAMWMGPGVGRGKGYPWISGTSSWAPQSWRGQECKPNSHRNLERIMPRFHSSGRKCNCTNHSKAFRNLAGGQEGADQRGGIWDEVLAISSCTTLGRSHSEPWFLHPWLSRGWNELIRKKGLTELLAYDKPLIHVHKCCNYCCWYYCHLITKSDFPIP